MALAIVVGLITVSQPVQETSNSGSGGVAGASLHRRSGESSPITQRVCEREAYSVHRA